VVRMDGELAGEAHRVRAPRLVLDPPLAAVAGPGAGAVAGPASDHYPGAGLVPAAGPALNTGTDTERRRIDAPGDAGAGCGGHDPGSSGVQHGEPTGRGRAARLGVIRPGPGRQPEVGGEVLGAESQPLQAGAAGRG